MTSTDCSGSCLPRGWTLGTNGTILTALMGEVLKKASSNEREWMNFGLDWHKLPTSDTQFGKLFITFDDLGTSSVR